MRLALIMLALILSGCAETETQTYHYSCNEVQFKNQDAHKMYIHCERLTY